MMVIRYRLYLANRAFPLDGLALVNEMRTQLVPWIALPLLLWGGCWLFSVSDEVQRWAMRIVVGVATVGSGLVMWEFFVGPLCTTVSTAWKRRDRT
ncbi:hypothetical protein [Novosphingobium gossypii]|uniref:hypothetical protein n=1 Tax=Novosphingobium gossypii TaxID=1604774 RepID=UPI003D223019